MQWKIPEIEKYWMVLLRERVHDMLPKDWFAGVQFGSGDGADGELELRAPDGTTAHVAVEVKKHLEPRQVILLAHQQRADKPLLVIAPFISPETQERLKQAGISFMDLTGNQWLVMSNPAVFLAAKGAEKNPYREKRPLHSLKGAGAAAATRALCDLAPPYGLHELAKKANVPVATLFRVVELLDLDALLQRGAKGDNIVPDWQGIVRRWARDYHVLKANPHVAYFEPRGLPRLVDRLRKYGGRYSVTGSLAANAIAPIAPPRLAMIYTDDITGLADTLDIKPVDTNPNVILIHPKADVALERTWQQDGITYAAHCQIAADLLNGPGRSPQEAEAIMEWMKQHESTWRT